MTDDTDDGTDTGDIDAAGPLEPPGGQDPEPPNLELAVLVALRVLLDVRHRLQGDLRGLDPDDDDEARDLLLRIAALVSVLRRIRQQLEERGPGE